jgi:hypothetical protein
MVLCATSAAWAQDNSPPDAFGQDFTVAQNTAVDIVLDGVDPDGDDLTFRVVSQPEHGTLTGTAPNLRYDPEADYAGPDAFTFVANDGQVDGQPATINITVEEQFNFPPAAQSQSVNLALNQDTDIVLRATDPNGDDLTYTIVLQPEHGTVTGQPPVVHYTPEQDFQGEDSFTFIANDGELDSNEATVFVNVAAGNVIPAAFSQNVTTDTDTPIAITLMGVDPENSDLTFRVTVSPGSGSLSGTPPNITYTPNQGFEGLDHFQFVANDGLDDSEPGVVSLVVGRNEAPVADNQALETETDSPISITLTGEDPDGDMLYFVVSGDPANGALTGTAPSLTYTPNQGFSGVDQFNFVIFDGDPEDEDDQRKLVSNVATITILVGVENLPPLAVSREISTDTDTALDITLEGADPEGRPLTFLLTVQPQHGILSGQIPNLLYAPDNGYNGRDQLMFTVSDGDLTSEPGTVDIIIGQLNQIPAALDFSVETPVNTAVTMTLQGLDGDRDALTYTIIAAPSRGVLSGEAPDLTYTPDQDYEGRDTVLYTVNDGIADSEVGEVTIQVGDPNEPPVAENLSASTDLDTPVDITLVGSDLEEADLTFQITLPPINGTVTGAGPIVRYTPNQNFTGHDFFSYVVNDGVQDSAGATVLVAVGQGNQAPIADPQQVSVPEDSVVDIVLVASDPDGDELTWAIVTQPRRGTLVGEGNRYRYTPPANFSGLDNFDFRVNDGELDSNIANVVVNVAPANDEPVVGDSTVTTNENVAVQFTLTGTDPDGDELTFEVITLPENGTLEGQSPQYTYTPAEGFAGTDSLVYRASDGELNSQPGTLTILVDNVNEAPEAQDVEATTTENTAVTITLNASDPDGDDLQFVVTGGPQGGVVNGEGPDVVYVPNPQFSGLDTFTYLVTDGRLISAEATVTITVTAVDDPPRADDGFAQTDQDTEVELMLLAFDADSENLTYTIMNPPQNGSVSGTGPIVVYTPNLGFSGDDSFTWTASDGQNTSNVATYTIQVIAEDAPPTAPVANSAEIETPEDIAVSVTLSGSDANGDELTFNIVSFPEHGLLSGQAPELEFIPNANFSGQDFFTFTASDGRFTSAPAIVTITVTPVNDPPEVVPQLINTNQGEAVSFTLVGDDIDGDILTFEIVEGPTGGTISGDLPAVTYSPREDFFGDDRMIVRANDGEADSPEAEIILRVRRANNTPPIADGQNVETDEDTAVEIELTGNDPDGDEIVFILITLPSNGTVEGQPPNLTYRPNRDYFGDDEFSFLVADETASSTVATVSLTIAPVNDPPVVQDAATTAEAGVPVRIAITAMDVDSEDLTFQVSRVPSNGVAQFDGSTVVYTSEDDFFGRDDFEVTVSDGELTATGIVTVEVLEGQAPPPAVTIHTPGVWLPAPGQLRGEVDDHGCTLAPTVTLLPQGLELTTTLVDGIHGFLSDPLSEGVHNLTVTALSGCTNTTGRGAIRLGVDATPATVTLAGLPQDRVDPEDPSTWPAVEPGEPLVVFVHVADPHSGIAEVHARVADAASERDESLSDEILLVRDGDPPAGLHVHSAPLCNGGDSCEGPGFLLAQFDADLAVITVSTLDAVGNASVNTLYLRRLGLRAAVVDWRTAVFALFTESPRALSYLDQGVAWMDFAVGELDAGRRDNATIAIMHAQSDMRSAEQFDNAATFENELREVVNLVSRTLRSQQAGALQELGDTGEIQKAWDHLRSAEAEVRGGSPDAALVNLANARLWLAIAYGVPSTDSPEEAMAILDTVVASMGNYGDDPQSPASDQIRTISANLAAATEPLSMLLADPNAPLADAYAVLSVLDDAGAALTPLIVEGAWTRTWEHALAVLIQSIVMVVNNRARDDLGEDHPFVERGTEAADRASQFLASGEVDRAFAEDRFLRCLGAAADQVANDAVAAVPPRCCHLFERWQDDEPSLVVPDSCE